jgi:hypothetical protein
MLQENRAKVTVRKQGNNLTLVEWADSWERADTIDEEAPEATAQWAIACAENKTQTPLHLPTKKKK